MQYPFHAAYKVCKGYTRKFFVGNCCPIKKKKKKINSTTQAHCHATCYCRVQVLHAWWCNICAIVDFGMHVQLHAIVACIAQHLCRCHALSCARVARQRHAQQMWNAQVLQVFHVAHGAAVNGLGWFLGNPGLPKSVRVTLGLLVI